MENKTHRVIIIAAIILGGCIIAGALAPRLFSRWERNRILRQAIANPLAADFEALDIPSAIKVYNAATNEEKRFIRETMERILIRKAGERKISFSHRSAIMEQFRLPVPESTQLEFDAAMDNLRRITSISDSDINAILSKSKETGYSEYLYDMSEPQQKAAISILNDLVKKHTTSSGNPWDIFPDAENFIEQKRPPTAREIFEAELQKLPPDQIQKINRIRSLRTAAIRLDFAQLDNALERREITPAQYTEIVDNIGLSPLIADFLLLDIRPAITVYHAVSAEERKSLRPFLYRKISNTYNLSDEHKKLFINALDHGQPLKEEQQEPDDFQAYLEKHAKPVQPAATATASGKLIPVDYDPLFDSGKQPAATATAEPSQEQQETDNFRAYLDQHSKIVRPAPAEKKEETPKQEP